MLVTAQRPNELHEHGSLLQSLPQSKSKQGFTQICFRNCCPNAYQGGQNSECNLISICLWQGTQTSTSATNLRLFCIAQHPASKFTVNIVAHRQKLSGRRGASAVRIFYLGLRVKLVSVRTSHSAGIKLHPVDFTYRVKETLQKSDILITEPFYDQKKCKPSLSFLSGDQGFTTQGR